MTWTAGTVLTAAHLNQYLPQEWGTYTPTLGGTGTTQGNATRTGGHMLRNGRTFDFWAQAVVGSTTVIGSEILLTLPFTAAGLRRHAALYGLFLDNSANYYTAVPILTTTSVVQLTSPGTLGVRTAPSSTSPFTWATGDIIFAGGTVERP